MPRPTGMYEIAILEFSLSYHNPRQMESGKKRRGFRRFCLELGFREFRRQGGDFIGRPFLGACFREFGINPTLEPAQNADLVPDMAPGCLLRGGTPEDAG